jgi:hypothetical protein
MPWFQPFFFFFFFSSSITAINISNQKKKKKNAVIEVISNYLTFHHFEASWRPTVKISVIPKI